MNDLAKKIIFWGTPDFALPSLQVLVKLNLVSAVITQPAKPAGRNKKLVSSPVEIYAQDHNLPILTPLVLNQDFVKELKQYLPATFVIVAYGRIIKQSILDLSDLPAINIHPSLLPELRGPSPIQTALLRGFNSTAVTLMQVDDKMDHGPILAQKQAIICPEDNYLTLSKALAEIGAQLLENTIISYLNNQIKGKPQDDTQATICHLIKKEDGQIDWSKTATEIHNQVRAFYHWPASYTKLKNLEIKIIQTKVIEKTLNPKEILIEDKRLIIGTGQNSLEILQLQPAGKKIITAPEFIRGYMK